MSNASSSIEPTMDGTHDLRETSLIDVCFVVAVLIEELRQEDLQIPREGQGDEGV